MSDAAMQTQLDETTVAVWPNDYRQYRRAYGADYDLVPCIALRVESTSDPQESGTAHLTAAEARRLAAELVALADAITRKGDHD